MPLSPDPPPRRGRPRLEDVDTRILDSAQALLRESGPTAVHIDPVAARAGVARTTVYRRYRNRRDLLTATLQRITSHGAPPIEATLSDKLRWVLARVRDVVGSGLGRGGIAAVLTDADPEFTVTLRATLAAQLQPLMDAMSADAARGRLHDVDPDVVVNLCFGAYLGELLRHGEERPDWLEATVTLIERAVGADSSQA